MSEYQSILGMLASIVGIIGYVPYYRDILAGTTKPHPFSWIAFALFLGIAFFGQEVSGGRPRRMGQWRERARGGRHCDPRSYEGGETYHPFRLDVFCGGAPGDRPVAHYARSAFRRRHRDYRGYDRIHADHSQSLFQAA